MLGMLMMCHRLNPIEIDTDSMTKMLIGLQLALLEVCIKAGFSPSDENEDI